MLQLVIIEISYFCVKCWFYCALIFNWALNECHWSDHVQLCNMKIFSAVWAGECKICLLVNNLVRVWWCFVQYCLYYFRWRLWWLSKFHSHVLSWCFQVYYWYQVLDRLISAYIVGNTFCQLLALFDVNGNMSVCAIKQRVIQRFNDVISK